MEKFYRFIVCLCEIIGSDFLHDLNKEIKVQKEEEKQSFVLDSLIDM